MSAELAPGGIGTTITVVKANSLLNEVEPGGEVVRYRVLIARELVADIAALDTTLGASKKRITAAVAASGTSLCDIYGVGPICAATIIGYVGDVGRFDTKAQFASYNGTAPLEASSGNRVRHRLNPRGNRTLNFAIHIAAVTQFRNPTEGRVFYDRKIAEGKTHKEAIRSLKRRISDRVYQHLIADAQRTETD
jgi:transposase